jgi:large conductance mechanosensitive channel
MSLADEFKDFAMKGNVVDLAVGVIIGAAFGKIVSSLVENILMPVLGILTGGVDFSKMAVPLGTGPNAVQWKYGMFIQSIFDFVIIAICIFAIVKMLNKMKKPVADGPPPAPPASEIYLKEIRDALVKR